MLIIFFIAAKLGEVCYSDTHCILADENNKCEFTIPGVFGFCVCDSNSHSDCPSKGQESALIKPNSSAFKYPFSKPDTKKKVPYQKRPWQTVDPRYTTTTTTVKPLRPVDKPQSFLSKLPVFKTNLTNNGIKSTPIPVINAQPSIVFHDYTTASLNTTTFKSQFSTVPTPSPIKIYLKSPPKGSQNKGQTIDNNTSIKPYKKPVSSSGKFKYINVIIYTNVVNFMLEIQ